MKRILLTALFFITFTFPVNVTADSDGDHVDLETAVPIILKKYGVDSLDALECEVFSDEDFEYIGDALMEEMHPGEAHEMMDEQMARLPDGQGGEGSEPLKVMHINMGKNYLGCGGSGMMGGMGSMEGRGNMMSGNNLVESSYDDTNVSDVRISGALSKLIAVSAIFFFTTGTYYFVKRSAQTKKK